MDYILETVGLSKSYGLKAVVDGVEMHVKRGDVYGFVGENGAGKTTVIRLITGLIKPNGGQIKFSKQESSQTLGGFEQKVKLAAVVETPSLNLAMTAKDNLVLQSKILGINDYSIIDKVLELVGLNYLANDKKKVKNFSLGMRQRLGIAVALLGEPELLILDEPMNGLDPEGIAEVRELILNLNKEKGITFIISSHILSELARVATNYGFIHQGKLVKEISKEELESCAKPRVDITVNDVDLAKALFEKSTMEFSINGNVVSIYSQISLASVLGGLEKHGVSVLSVNTAKENIEDFYFKLIGGAKHA